MQVFREHSAYSTKKGKTTKTEEEKNKISMQQKYYYSTVSNESFVHNIISLVHIKYRFIQVRIWRISVIYKILSDRQLSLSGTKNCFCKFFNISFVGFLTL